MSHMAKVKSDEIKTVGLEWQGPITLQKTHPDVAKGKLNCSGVYAWVYPSPPYKTPGIYFGYSSNLANRIWKHFGELLSGNYYVPDRDNPDISNPEINPSESLNEYLFDLERLLESAKEAEIYFAVKEGVEDETFHDIERALIEAMTSKYGTNDGNYFAGNSGLRGCKSFSGKRTTGKLGNCPDKGDDKALPHKSEEQSGHFSLLYKAG